MKRKGVSTVVYCSQTAKLLNKAEDNEEKTEIQRQKQSYLIIAPVTQGNMDASHLLNTGGVMHLDCQRETVRWSRDENGLGFLLTVCSLVQGFRLS